MAGVAMKSDQRAWPQLAQCGHQGSAVVGVVATQSTIRQTEIDPCAQAKNAGSLSGLTRTALWRAPAREFTARSVDHRDPQALPDMGGDQTTGVDLGVIGMGREDDEIGVHKTFARIGSRYGRFFISCRSISMSMSMLI